MNYLFNKQKQEQQKQLKRKNTKQYKNMNNGGGSPIGNDGC